MRKIRILLIASVVAVAIICSSVVVCAGTCEHHDWEWGLITDIVRTDTTGSATIHKKCNVCGKEINETVQVSFPKKEYTYNGTAQYPVPVIIASDDIKDSISIEYYKWYWTNNGLPGCREMNPAMESVAVDSYIFKVIIAGASSADGSQQIYEDKYVIKPLATEITKLTGGKKRFTAKWEDTGYQPTGFQLRYSTKASMKNAKVIKVNGSMISSKSVKKLKSKTKYYVQIRSYRQVIVGHSSIVNGNVYSDWSTKKTVKTK